MVSANKSAIDNTRTLGQRVVSNGIESENTISSNADLENYAGKTMRIVDEKGYGRFGDDKYKKLKEHGYDCADFDMSNTETSLYEADEADAALMLQKEKQLAEEQKKICYLMKHIEKTGVLIEGGFISNPTDEAKLRFATYQQKLCGAIAAGLCIYLGS